LPGPAGRSVGFTLLGEQLHFGFVPPAAGDHEDQWNIDPRNQIGINKTADIFLGSQAP